MHAAPSGGNSADQSQLGVNCKEWITKDPKLISCAVVLKNMVSWPSNCDQEHKTSGRESDRKTEGQEHVSQKPNSDNRDNHGINETQVNFSAPHSIMDIQHLSFEETNKGSELVGKESHICNVSDQKSHSKGQSKMLDSSPTGEKVNIKVHKKESTTDKEHDIKLATTLSDNILKSDVTVSIDSNQNLEKLENGNSRKRASSTDLAGRGEEMEKKSRHSDLNITHSRKDVHKGHQDPTRKHPDMLQEGSPSSMTRDSTSRSRSGSRTPESSHKSSHKSQFPFDGTDSSNPKHNPFNDLDLRKRISSQNIDPVTGVMDSSPLPQVSPGGSHLGSLSSLATGSSILLSSGKPWNDFTLLHPLFVALAWDALFSGVWVISINCRASLVTCVSLHKLVLAWCRCLLF